MILYIYHKKFTRFSKGGVSTPIDKKTARCILTKERKKGKIEIEDYWRRHKGERVLKFENGNYLFIYAV